MKITDIIIITGILVTALPIKAQAQDVEEYRDYQVSCSLSINCNNFDIIYEQTSKDNQQIAQRKNSRTRNYNSEKNLYLEVNGGVYFTGGATMTGYGPSIIAGLNIGQYSSLELEGFYYFGDLDNDFLFDTSQIQFLNDNNINADFDYSVLGIAANLVTKYPFDKENPRSIYGIAGFGVGYSQLKTSGEFSGSINTSSIDREGFQFDGEASTSGLLLNSKLGLGIPITDALDLKGQVRYSYGFYPDIEGVSYEDDSLSVDAGIKLNF